MPALTGGFGAYDVGLASEAGARLDANREIVAPRFSDILPGLPVGTCMFAVAPALATEERAANGLFSERRLGTGVAAFRSSTEAARSAGGG